MRDVYDRNINLVKQNGNLGLEVLLLNQLLELHKRRDAIKFGLGYFSSRLLWTVAIDRKEAALAEHRKEQEVKIIKLHS